MPRFALEKIIEIDGRINFYKLKIDGSSDYDLFIDQCIKEGAYESELVTLQSRMQQISDLKTLPETKHRDITPKKSAIKQYEFKTKNLRVYTFHDKSNGRVIVLGGKKGTQKKDIKRFRGIIDEYFKKH